MLSEFGSTSDFNPLNICCAKLVNGSTFVVQKCWFNQLDQHPDQHLPSSVLNVVQTHDVDPKCWSRWLAQHFAQHFVEWNVVQTSLHNIFTQHMLISFLDQHDVDRFQNHTKTTKTQQIWSAGPIQTQDPAKTPRNADYRSGARTGPVVSCRWRGGMSGSTEVTARHWSSIKC